VIFGYADNRKDPRKVREFASAVIRPSYADRRTGKYARFSVSATLKSQDDDAFHLSKGIGVAVLLEKTSPGVLDLAALGDKAQRSIRIDTAALAFTPRPRDDDVQV
jgi:hypothetical protein